MVAPILALHGLLVGGAILVRTANNVFESFSQHQDPTPPMNEALSLDVKAPMELASTFITNYDHLHHDGWYGLRPWLSSYNPPKEIYGNVHSVRHSGDDNNLQQYSYCVVAETIRTTSVDNIMDSLVPKRRKKKRGSGANMARRKRADLEHRATIPYNVCMEWTVAAHTDKPKDWSHVALAITVSRIRTIDSTAVRLAILHSEVQPAEIPLLILDLVLEQKVDTLTAMAATVMRWVKQKSESKLKEDAEARSMTSTVKTMLKNAGRVDNVLSQDTKEAIQSNYAQEILEKIESIVSPENDRGLSSDREGESSIHQPTQPVSNENSVPPAEFPGQTMQADYQASKAPGRGIVSEFPNARLSETQSSEQEASANQPMYRPDSTGLGADVDTPINAQSLDKLSVIAGNGQETPQSKAVPDEEIISDIRSDEYVHDHESNDNQDGGGNLSVSARIAQTGGDIKAEDPKAEADKLSQSASKGNSRDVAKIGAAAEKVSEKERPVDKKNHVYDKVQKGGDSASPGTRKSENFQKAKSARSHKNVNFTERSPSDQKRYLLISIAASLCLFNLYLCVAR